MKLSSEQIERLSDRVYQVLNLSGYVDFDNQVDERIEEKTADVINDVISEDSRTEDRLAREAERLVNHQSQIAKSSGKTFEALVEEVKVRLAKSKNFILGEAPERADFLAEKIFKQLWKMDGLDFFADDFKVINCIARAIHRFRIEDDRILEAAEKLTSKKTEEAPYSHAWCLVFDRQYADILKKIANQRDQVASEGS